MRLVSPNPYLPFIKGGIFLLLYVLLGGSTYDVHPGWPKEVGKVAMVRARAPLSLFPFLG